VLPGHGSRCHSAPGSVEEIVKLLPVEEIVKLLPVEEIVKLLPVEAPTKRGPYRPRTEE
jgi:hypothetical protein